MNAVGIHEQHPLVSANGYPVIRSNQHFSDSCHMQNPNNLMKSRRQFFKSATALGLLGVVGLPVSARAAETPATAAISGDDRRYWVSITGRIARPVLENLARRELKKNMPVEERSGAKRAGYTHLEAFGRLLCGIAPWLALDNLAGDERKLQQELSKLARLSLDAATDPASPDFMNFSRDRQPLVDAWAGRKLPNPGPLPTRRL